MVVVILVLLDLLLSLLAGLLELHKELLQKGHNLKPILDGIRFLLFHI